MFHVFYAGWSRHHNSSSGKAVCGISWFILCETRGPCVWSINLSRDPCRWGDKSKSSAQTLQAVEDWLHPVPPGSPGKSKQEGEGKVNPQKTTEKAAGATWSSAVFEYNGWARRWKNMPSGKLCGLGFIACSNYASFTHSGRLPPIVISLQWFMPLPLWPNLGEKRRWAGAELRTVWENRLPFKSHQ